VLHTRSRGAGRWRDEIGGPITTDRDVKYIIRTKPFPAEPPTYWIPQRNATYRRSSDRVSALARAFSSEAAARAYMAAHGDPTGIQNEVIGVEHMYAYETVATVEGDDLPSNRYGTREAIRERFRDLVKIVEAPPVEVDPKEFCLHWPGFARKGFKP
jgi:hypothetical protein